MKYLDKIIIIIFLTVILLTGCSNDIKPAGGEVPIVENNETKDSLVSDKPKEDIKPEIEDKDLIEVYAIFYSMEDEKVDMLILDDKFPQEDIILNDEVKVFLTKKDTNSVVLLKIKHDNNNISVYDASEVSQAKLNAKYIGFADNNFAEFKISNIPFVLQIPEELRTDLDNIEPNELLEISIESNKIPSANPVLLSLKKF